MENARAHQKHQDLVVGDARTLVHGLQAVQKAYYFLLIEVRDRGKHRTAKCVLHERTESLIGIEGSGRAQKRMLLSPVNSIGDDVPNGLAKNELLSHTADLQGHRLRTEHFNDMMIEERHTSLDGVRHLHAI